jgi:hypothetical protein
MPTISVIMPAYNAEKYLTAAIDSILGQTFRDIELLVIDDGSCDATAAIVSGYADPRVILLSNAGNRGLIYSRNLGIDVAQAPYIAFLDSDDIAFPERLACQLAYLQAHPDIAAVGSWTQPMDQDGVYRPYVWQYPGDSDFLRATFLFRCYITTSAFFARAEVLKTLRFAAAHDLAEDYDLYNRGMALYKFENIQQPLIAYRVHSNNISKIKRERLDWNMQEISLRLLRALGLDPSADEMALHRYIERLDVPPHDVLRRSRAWLQKIEAANRQAQVYPPHAMGHAVAERWFSVCYANASIAVLPTYLCGPLTAGGVLGMKAYGKLLLKSFAHTLQPSRASKAR